MGMRVSALFFATKVELENNLLRAVQKLNAARILGDYTESTIQHDPEAESTDDRNSHCQLVCSTGLPSGSEECDAVKLVRHILKGAADFTHLSRKCHLIRSAHDRDHLFVWLVFYSGPTPGHLLTLLIHRVKDIHQFIQLIVSPFAFARGVHGSAPVQFVMLRSSDPTLDKAALSYPIINARYTRFLTQRLNRMFWSKVKLEDVLSLFDKDFIYDTLPLMRADIEELLPYSDSSLSMNSLVYSHPCAPILAMMTIHTMYFHRVSLVATTHICAILLTSAFVSIVAQWNCLSIYKVKSVSDRTTNQSVSTCKRKSHPLLYNHKRESGKGWDPLLVHFFDLSFRHSPTRRQRVQCYTVVKYPMGYTSPAVSLKKQQQLDSLGARDFVDAIHHSLTVEERESLMLQERQRLRTYENGWPHESYIPSILMAQAGFYYLADADKVQCVFCRGVLHNWLPGDRPMEEHSKHFRNCKLVRGVPCGNVPYNANGEALRNDMLTNIKLLSSLDKTTPKDLGISTHKASKPEYAAEASRIRTFGRFPASCPVPAEKICEAGFYYTGFDDTVKCFWCEGGLEKWERGDDPWQEHSRNFPECQFVISVKGALSRPSTSQASSSTSAAQEDSYYASMIKYCEHVGHRREDIDKVIRNNKKKPLSSTKEMLEALYALEDDGERSGNTDPMTDSDSGYNSTKMDDDSDSLISGQWTCKRCPKGNQASNIGLPCGCLLFCADCVTNRPHTVCPTCNKHLNGFMKVYLS